ncbi:MAG TPA: rhomboid family intramembrane serine protease [Abditibacteriaceae bacterium]|nr:rhomboid family intramembrane serine protease [Abditibacteriaceae bacterium]
MNYDSDTAAPGSDDLPPEPAREFVPFVVYGLMAANIVVFVLTGLNGGFFDTAGETLHRFGMLYAPDILEGQWWRLASAMFLHAGLLHIAINMWALKNLGEELEHIYGPAIFLLLYLGAGWVGALASLMFTGASVGASGAIVGLAGAWLAVALRNRRYFQEFGQQVLVVIAINLFIGFSAQSLIDNNGHIGGLIGGFLLGLILPNRLPEFREGRWRWPAAVALVLLFLAATPLAMRVALSTLRD